jgi:hypothetical protein
LRKDIKNNTTEEIKRQHRSRRRRRQTADQVENVGVVLQIPMWKVDHCWEESFGLSFSLLELGITIAFGVNVNLARRNYSPLETLSTISA